MRLAKAGPNARPFSLCRQADGVYRAAGNECADGMLAFIIRRLLQAIVVMLTVALIAFTLFRFVGDPVNQMVGIETTRRRTRRAARATRPE